MLKTRLTILVSTLVIPLRRVFVPVALVVIGAGLAACGQTGQLYLPKQDPAAAHRASLPKSLWPFMPSKKKEDDKPQADGNAKTDDNAETRRNDNSFDPLPEQP